MWILAVPLLDELNASGEAVDRLRELEFAASGTVHDVV
jgi:hypothetical protein